MAHDAHDDPSTLPPYRDEASDTPLWVPALGAALLLFGVGLVGMRAAMPDDEPTPADAAPADTGEAAAAAAPSAEGAPPGGAVDEVRGNPNADAPAH